METLANWIHRRGPLPPREAVGWAIRLAKHLEALHQHGVAHGNVSPACVLVGTNDPRGRGMVADVRRTAEMIQYHSGERLRDGQLTPADDTWGVAATLFTTLTAARPFGDAQQEVLARQPHGVPALAAYRIQDENLQAILSAALSPDPSRRITNVQHLRQHLERWFGDPSVHDLRPLDDEEAGEDDQAATAMLAMDQMFDEPRSSQPESNLFAPPSFVQSVPGARPSAPGSAQPSRPGGPPPRAPAAPPLAPAPLGEQDATVMRELPAHIMAMAARAAGGSNPPPPPAPQPPDEDTGGATRVGNTADIAASMQRAQLAPPPTPAMPAPQGGPSSQPGGPTSPRPGPPGGRPPRAIRSTQLGVGMLQPPNQPPNMGAPNPGAPNLGAPNAGPPAQPPQPPAGAPPRPGFAPPPSTLSSAPPPRDPDEVRTMMHPTAETLKALGRTAPNLSGGPPMPPARPSQPQPPPQPPTPPPQPAQPEPPPDDDDDGGRTVLREPPSFDEFFRPPDAPGAPPAPQAQWKPAAPPVQPRAFGQGATDRPPGAPPAPAGPGGSGVSALIQETLENMGPGQGPPGAPQGGPPPGFPPPMEPTGGFGPMGHDWGQQVPAQAPGMPGPMGGGVSGPFQPLGAQPGPFAPQQQLAPGGPFGPQPFMPGGHPSDPMIQPGMDVMQQQQQQPPMPEMGGPVAYPVGAGIAAADSSSKRKGSKVGLLVVCFLVLVLAAALTFIFLRYRHTLTFLPENLRGAPP